MRVGSLNVGTVTGKGRSLADMMETRKVGLLFVCKRLDGRGTKRNNWGSGANEQEWNGVGIVLSNEYYPMN